MGWILLDLDHWEGGVTWSKIDTFIWKCNSSEIARGWLCLCSGSSETEQKDYKDNKFVVINFT